MIYVDRVEDMHREVRDRNLFLYRLDGNRLRVAPQDAAKPLAQFIADYKTELLETAVPWSDSATGGWIHEMRHPLVPGGYYFTADDAILTTNRPVLTYSEWARVRNEPMGQIAFILELKSYFGGAIVPSPFPQVEPYPIQSSDGGEEADYAI